MSQGPSRPPREAAPPVEYWRGRLHVPREPQPPPSRRHLVRRCLLATAAGLTALGLLHLVARLGAGDVVVSGGAGIIAGLSLLIAVGLASPLPISWEFYWDQNIFPAHPDPVPGEALIVLSFGAPSVIWVAVAIATSP